MKVSGIYMIQSISKPERVYIGSAVDIQRRWKEHKNTLNRGIHRSVKLQNHYNKYGEFDLVFSIMEICSIDLLIIKEQLQLDQLYPWFNVALVAGSPMLNRKHSKETKDKMSKKLLGNKRGVGHTHISSISQIENIVKANTGNKYWEGKHHSKETRDILTNIHKIPIIQYGLNMGFIREWPSAKDAAKELGLERTGISKCVIGRYKSASGFIWKYKFEKAVA